MEVPHMSCLEIVTDVKLLNSLEVIAFIEFQGSMDIGFRSPGESDGRKFLNALESVKTEFKIGPLMSDKQIRFASHIEKDLREFRTWGAADVERSNNRCLVMVYDFGRLSDYGRSHLREVLVEFGEYFRLEPQIDWDSWSGKAQVLAAVQHKLTL